MESIQKALAYLQQLSQSPQAQSAKQIAMPSSSTPPLQQGQGVASFPGYQEAQARGGFDGPPQEADTTAIMQAIQSFISGFGKESTHSFRKPGFEGVGPQPTSSPMDTPQLPNQQQPAPQDPADAELEAKILEGYRKYSGGKPVAMEKHIPAMVQAAKQYPVFQENPMLIPATSIVETSAGENYRLNNNPLSWGARLQQSGQYSPKSEEESIRDMITAVGGDPKRGEGFDPETAKNRMRTAGYYDKFRKSGDLKDFTDTYDGGNEKYLPALLAALKNFQ